MTVEQNIKAIIESMGLDYICESWHRANLVLDRYQRRANKRVTATDGHKLPVGIYLQPKNGTLNIADRGSVTDAPSCMVCFADEMPFGFTGRQAVEVAERLKAMAEEFVRRVRDCEELKPISGAIAYNIGYDAADANLCVVTLNATIEEAQGRCI